MKVLLIGFDGADWEIVERLMREGKLPNFKKVSKKGAFSKLKSVIPPLSPPAWASIVTGVNPGKHGVFEFIKFDRENFEKRIELNPIKTKKIWTYLGEAGYTSIVINFPIMYPPEKIKGITISGMVTPSSAKYFTYPKHLSEKLKRRGYEVEIPEDELFKLLMSDKEKLYQRLMDNLRKRAKISLGLLKHYDWDFTMIVFGESDRIQHFFWRDKQKIENMYKELDKILGMFMEFVDENTLLIVVSDHGFRGIERYFYVNSWLYHEGLLALKSGANQSFGAREKILRILSILHLTWILKYVPSFIGKKIPDSKLKLNNIDKEKTRALCISGYGYVILNGNWSKEELEELRTKLLNIRDPKTGKKPVSAVYMKDEIFSGEYLKDAPDLIIMPAEGYALQDKYITSEIFGDVSEAPGLAKREGEHDMYGIFLAYHKKYKIQIKTKSPSVCDIAPTVLLTYGIPEDKKSFDGSNILSINSEVSSNQ